MVLALLWFLSGWSMLGGADGASTVPRNLGQEETDLQAECVMWSHVQNMVGK